MTMINFCRYCMWVLPCLTLAVGCGESGPRTYPVSGKVSLNGEPVPQGSIVFRDAAGEAPSYAGKIIDGSYSLQSTEGSKTVEITARRAVEGEFSSPAPGEPEEPVLEQYIPEEYNSKSTLNVEVPSGGNTDLNFELTGTRS